MVTWVSDQIGVVESAVNIGIIQNSSDLILIDTGIDNSAVNKARKQVEKDVTAALITHHHADHMGGANKLENLGVTDIYGPEKELPFIHNTILEPMTMFGGSIPPEILRNRHLEARSAPSVLPTTQQDYVEVVSCPGHTPDHQSFLYGDIIFTGDAAFTADTIDKYHLLFAVDPKEAASSIDSILNYSFDIMIPGHGSIQESRTDAIQVLRDTKDHYFTMKETILQIIGEEIELDRYLKTTMQELELTDIVKERGYLQYILYQVPLQGYLSNLLDEGEVTIDLTSNGPIVIAN